MSWKALSLLAQAVRYTWTDWDCFVPILLFWLHAPLCALTVSQPKPQDFFFVCVCFCSLTSGRSWASDHWCWFFLCSFPLLRFGIAGFSRAFLSKARQDLPLLSSLELSAGSELQRPWEEDCLPLLGRAKGFGQLLTKGDSSSLRVFLFYVFCVE